MGDIEPRPTAPQPAVSDAERERVVLALRDHVTEGRLTLDEFSDRCGEAWNAKTRSELAEALRDLPAMATPVPEERRRKVTRTAVAVMGGHEQRNRWRAGDEINAIAVMGGCVLDFRQAEIDTPVVTVNAFALMGGIDIIVPEGIEVELSGLAFMGGKENRVTYDARLRGGPVIHVRAVAIMGSVVARTKRPRSERRGAAAVGTPPAPPALPSPPDPARHRDHDRDRARDRGDRSSRRREPSPLPTAPDGTVTILFSDIEGYTAMTERLGDVAAHELLRTHNRIVRRHISDCDGYEVKNQGDGFMVAFPSARKALRCAVAIQRAFEQHNIDHPLEQIRVRIGLHTGEALLDDGDFTGRAVILASRIAAHGEGGQVLVSSLVKELTESTGEFTFDDGHDVSLKGLSQPQRVHHLIW